jgi:methylmalonyl-CoA/ethylmalonyl-CoA epimerase
MLNDFIFHHIGVATDNIDATAKVYEQGGFVRSENVVDPIQNVIICWLKREGMPIIELIAPMDQSSPVKTILDKNGVTPYHICYVVENIDSVALQLRQSRFVMVSRPVEAAAFKGSRVAFFYNKSVGLIELVEKPAEMVR